MSFGSFDQDRTPPIAEINTTPLIDVLLVLLVVFLVTLPLTSTIVPVDLPKVSGQTATVSDKVLEITVNREGKLFLSDRLILVNEVDQLFSSVEKNGQTIRLRVDARAEFDQVAELLSLANQHHITRISFVTLVSEPNQ